MSKIIPACSIASHRFSAAARYNIESLTVGHTERPGISRMTIVAGISEGAAQRVEANLYKLVPVLSVEDVTHSPTTSRSLALIKVEAQEESRHRLMEIVRVFRARVVDLAAQSLVIEITGTEEKIQALRGSAASLRNSGNGQDRASSDVARREAQARRRVRGFGRIGIRNRSFAIGLRKFIEALSGGNMATIYHGKCRRSGAHSREKNCHHWIRLAGPRPRSESAR